jgi:tetratricopeptide (TPR) repeat protein/predicted aspartyl protease
MNRTRIGLLLLGIGCLAGLATLNAQESKPPNPPAADSSATAPNVANPTLDDALRLYRTGKFDAAIQEYQALENGPQAALAYAQITRVYLRKKDPRNAYAAAAKAVELAPDAPDTKLALGEIYFRQGKIIEADHEYAAVINGGAKIARAYLGLARTSAANSYYHREKQMIDRAHALDPADPEITSFWIRMLPLSDRIKALSDSLAQDTDDDAIAHKARALELAFLQGQLSAPEHQCRMISKISSTQTELKELYDGPKRFQGYGVDVKLNGTSAHLLLDTGASGILVDRKIAEKAGVQQIVQTTIQGYGDRGPAAGYVGHADSIQVGELEFQDCNVRVDDQNSVVGRDGLIGANVFSSFLVDLDMPDKKIRLSELPPRPDEPTEAASLDSGSRPDVRYHDRYVAPEMRDYTPVFRFGHMLLIPTTLNDSVSKLFVIDTGAAMNTVSPDAAREVTNVSGDSRMTVKGLSGRVTNVYRGDELTLTFAHLRQQNQDIVAFDTKYQSDSIGTELSGGLGIPVLKMLDTKIDYRDGLVFFSFDPKRFH